MAFYRILQTTAIQSLNSITYIAETTLTATSFTVLTASSPSGNAGFYLAEKGDYEIDAFITEYIGATSVASASRSVFSLYLTEPGDSATMITNSERMGAGVTALTGGIVGPLTCATKLKWMITAPHADCRVDMYYKLTTAPSAGSWVLVNSSTYVTGIATSSYVTYRRVK
jgi:hypothetical protein